MNSSKPANLLESLKQYSVIVADTGDIEAIARLRPQDATTNPSLLYQSAQNPKYRALADDALAFGMGVKGDRKGQYSIRINDQWRICFEWPEKSPGPTNVEIVDYH